jgi:hypothetical protein
MSPTRTKHASVAGSVLWAVLLFDVVKQAQVLAAQAMREPGGGFGGGGEALNLELPDVPFKSCFFLFAA